MHVVKITIAWKWARLIVTIFCPLDLLAFNFCLRITLILPVDYRKISATNWLHLFLLAFLILFWSWKLSIPIWPLFPVMTFRWLQKQKRWFVIVNPWSTSTRYFLIVFSIFSDSIFCFLFFTIHFVDVSNRENMISYEIIQEKQVKLTVIFQSFEFLQKLVKIFK